MSDTLEKGDLVALKSGGPTMTYVGAHAYGDALCYWFEGKARQVETFPYVALRRVEDRK